MASIAHAPGLAACMARHQASLPGYEAQLHILYLANDVLLKRCAALMPCQILCLGPLA